MDRKNIKKTEKLYGALGELIYAVTKADGSIQPSEFVELEHILRGHHWADTIKWSFQYEVKRNSDPEQVFQKVINKCDSHGPAREYMEFISIINQVAEASNGIDEQEEKVISSFSKDLIERFQKKISTLNTRS